VIRLHTQVTGVERLKDDIRGLQPKARTALRRELNAIGAMLRDYIRSRKLEGQVLKRQTGRLWKSIRYTMEDQGLDTMYVEVGTDVKSPVSQRAVRTRAGRFTGKMKTKGGFPYGAYWETDGGRPFLRPALDEKRVEIRERIRLAVTQGATRGP
jgi:hypothetical protein